VVHLTYTFRGPACLPLLPGSLLPATGFRHCLPAMPIPCAAPACRLPRKDFLEGPGHRTTACLRHIPATTTLQLGLHCYHTGYCMPPPASGICRLPEQDPWLLSWEEEHLLPAMGLSFLGGIGPGLWDTAAARNMPPASVIGHHLLRLCQRFLGEDSPALCAMVSCAEPLPCLP